MNKFRDFEGYRNLAEKSNDPKVLHTLLETLVDEIPKCKEMDQRELRQIASDTAKKLTQLWTPKKIGWMESIGRTILRKPAASPSQISEDTGLLIARILGTSTEMFIFERLLSEGGKKTLLYLLTDPFIPGEIAKKAADAIFTKELSVNELHVLSTHTTSCDEALTRLGALSYQEHADIVQKTLLDSATPSDKKALNQMAQSILDDPSINDPRPLHFAMLKKCSGDVAEEALEKLSLNPDPENLMEVYNTRIADRENESLEQQREKIFMTIISRADEIPALQGYAWGGEGETQDGTCDQFRLHCIAALQTGTGTIPMADLLCRSRTNADEMLACAEALPAIKKYVQRAYDLAVRERNTRVLLRIAETEINTNVGRLAINNAIDIFSQRSHVSPEEEVVLRTLIPFYPGLKEQIESVLPKSAEQAEFDLENK